MSRDAMKADHYDDFADSYEAENASSLLNAYYERPAMLSLAGNVDGRRILDAGCGSGPLSAALRANGAIMTGFDGSPAMVELARQRLGDDAPRYTWPTLPVRCLLPTTRSMMSLHHSSCTIWATGQARSPNCGEC